MNVWYIHSLQRGAHERNHYRWKALKKAHEAQGDTFYCHNLQAEASRRTIRHDKADLTYACDFRATEVIRDIGVDLKRFGLRVNITGGGWRRPSWIKRNLQGVRDFRPRAVFLSHRVLLNEFRAITSRTFYVGLGFAPNVFYPTVDGEPEPWAGETREIVFCGNPAMGRLRRLEKLRKYVGRRIAWRQGFSHAQMAGFLRSGTIGWNQIAEGPERGVSCNLRTCEVLGCGILLLCSRSKHMAFLKDGSHYVAWGNDEEMLDKASYYLSHPIERARIAKQGWEEAISKHTWAHRAQEYIQIVARFL